MTNNLIGALLGFLTVPLVTHAFGPDGLGAFDYSTESMRVFLDLLGVGVPTALFTWISRETPEKSLLGVLFGFLFCLCVILLGWVILIAANSTQSIDLIWPAMRFDILCLALLTQGVVFFQTFTSQWADGVGQTVVMERYRTAQNTLRAAIILACGTLGSLTLERYFHIQWSLAAMFTMLVAYQIHAKSSVRLSFANITKSQILELTRFCVYFVAPLLLTTIVAFAADYTTGWMLQRFGGNTQRGFFGLGSRIGNIIFLFASALTPIMIRELSIATKKNDASKVRDLFNRSKSIIFITAAIGIFAVFNNALIVQVIGGQMFEGAAIAVAIYCLYPIHQVFGQLTGAYFLSSGKTNVYGVCAIFYAVLTVPVCYFLLAPKTAILPGLNLGALGRSLQLVGIQIFSTNTLLYLVCKEAQMNFRKWIGYQITLLSLLALLALAATFGSQFMIGMINLKYLISTSLPFLQLSLAGAFYALLVVLLLGAFPSLAGLLPTELKNLPRLLWK